MFSRYNGISLGLAVLASAAVISDHDLVGSMLFCCRYVTSQPRTETCSLLFKQMSLYFAPAFFSFLLGKALAKSSWRAR